MKFKTIVNNLKSSQHLKLIEHLCFIKKVNTNPIKKNIIKMMKIQKFKLKLLLMLTIPSISIVFMSCLKTSTIKSKEHAQEITYLVSTIKTTKKVEIVNYKSDSKNNLIITL